MTAVALLVCFVASMVLVFLTNWLALIPWRRSAGEHWTIRARLLFPGRVSTYLHFFYAPLFVIISSLLLWPEIHAFGTLFCAAYAGAVLGMYPMRKEVFPDVPMGTFFIGTPLVMYLMLGPLLLTALCAAGMPLTLGPATWLVAGVYFFYQTFSFTQLDFWLLRHLGIIRLAPPRLQAIVDEVSARMATPVAQTFVMPGPSANAFALPQRGQLIFTTRVMAHFSDDEIKAICAHEVGHLRQKKIFRSRLIQMRLGLTPFIFVKPLCHYFGPLGLLIPAGAFVLASYLVRGMGRRMETEADVAAVENIEDPAVYARALEHIYRLNQMPAAMASKRRLPHPDLYDRMVKAGVTPDFPKPPPAKRFYTLSFLFTIIIGVMLGVLLAVKFP